MLLDLVFLSTWGFSIESPFLLVAPPLVVGATVQLAERCCRHYFLATQLGTFPEERFFVCCDLRFDVETCVSGLQRVEKIQLRFVIFFRARMDKNQFFEIAIPSDEDIHLSLVGFEQDEDSRSPGPHRKEILPVPFHGAEGIEENKASL